MQDFDIYFGSFRRDPLPDICLDKKWVFIFALLGFPAVLINYKVYHAGSVTKNTSESLGYIKG